MLCLQYGVYEYGIPFYYKQLFEPCFAFLPLEVKCLSFEWYKNKTYFYFYHWNFENQFLDGIKYRDDFEQMLQTSDSGSIRYAGGEKRIYEKTENEIPDRSETQW